MNELCELSRVRLNGRCWSESLGRTERVSFELAPTGFQWHMRRSRMGRSF